jgi:hypothetical protein
MCQFYSSLSFLCTCLFFCSKRDCAASERVCSMAALAVLGLVWSIAACAAPGRSSSTAVYCPWAYLYVSSTVQQSVLSLEVSLMQQLVLHLDVSVRQQPVLCHGLKQLVVHLDGLSTRASAAPRRVCLQEPVLHLCMTVYQSFVLHLCLSVYQVFVLHLGVSAYKSTVYAIPEEYSLQKIFCLFRFFRNRFVCFGCFDTCSKHRNKPKKKFFGFMKQTEKQSKQIVFRFFSVQTENIFCLFRGHPTSLHLRSPSLASAIL